MDLILSKSYYRLQGQVLKVSSYRKKYKIEQTITKHSTRLSMSPSIGSSSQTEEEEASREEPEYKVFLYNIPDWWSTQVLADYLTTFGEITNAKITSSYKNDSGEDRIAAEVLFKTEKAAAEAICKRVLQVDQDEIRIYPFIQEPVQQIGKKKTRWSVHESQIKEQLLANSNAIHNSQGNPTYKPLVFPKVDFGERKRKSKIPLVSHIFRKKDHENKNLRVNSPNLVKSYLQKMINAKKMMNQLSF